MGQRSQIYIRYNKKVIVANYYQWNYGDRMISRARYGLEHLKYYLDNGFNWYFENSRDVEKIRRYFDVNFDYKDIVMSCNIINEYKEYKNDDENFCDFAFKGQDNNDGVLLIDIETKEKTSFNKQEYSLKYCFASYDLDVPINATDYMNWDYESWQTSEYISDELKNLCKDNIKEIEKFEMMNLQEFEEFISTNDFME